MQAFFFRISNERIFIMKQKIVFFDIDGTLITEDGNQTLPESTVYAIQ